MDFDQESQTPNVGTPSENITPASHNTSTDQKKTYKIQVDGQTSQPSCQNPTYTGIGSSDAVPDYENPELERQLSENPRYSVIENSVANHEAECESEELARSLRKNPSYIATDNSDVVPGDEEAAIPLRRNRSYRMLDVGETGASISETGETVYSYPKIRHSHSNTQEHIPKTDSDVQTSTADPYSKIELSNMYENLQPADDNMTANGVYGEFDGDGGFLTEDPYHYIPT